MQLVFAQNEDNNLDPETTNPSPTTAPGGNIDEINILFTNPIGGSGGTGINSIGELIEAILRIIVTIGIPIIVLAIIYTGFLFVKAMGKPEKVKEAREAFTWVVVGAIVVLASFVIAEAIEATIQQIINAT